MSRSSWPARASGPAPAGAARQVDVAPTLSALLGLAVPSSNQGRPLLDALALEPRSAG